MMLIMSNMSLETDDIDGSESNDDELSFLQKLFLSIIQIL